MTALEFIHKHQNDEDNGECLILPDGSVEEPLPSHIGRLVELTGMDAGALHGRMEKNMEPLFWLVEYTGCMSVWQTRVVAPTILETSLWNTTLQWHLTTFETNLSLITERALAPL